jgi:hypothetical protein
MPGDVHIAGAAGDSVRRDYDFLGFSWTFWSGAQGASARPVQEFRQLSLVVESDNRRFGAEEIERSAAGSVAGATGRSENLANLAMGHDLEPSFGYFSP